MCSINGAIRCDDGILNINKIQKIIKNGEKRGRDSWGHVSLFDNEQTIYDRKIGQPTESLSEIFDKKRVNWKKAKILINNNRAEPTTEYVKKKTKEDVQPFTDNENRFFVVHNGTIANDNDLKKAFNLQPKTKIDTAVIPYILNKCFSNGIDGSQLQNLLVDKIKGSYAFAIVDKNDLNTLWLATNYKPLFIQYNYSDKCLYFSSMDSYLGDDDIRKISNGTQTKKVEPYSLLKIQCHDKVSIDKFDLRKKKRKEKNKKVAVIASGGLDSTVCAKKMLDEGYDVELLHFIYNCRAENKEKKAVKKISQILDIDLTFIQVDFIKDIIGGSKLTNSNNNKIADGITGAEFAVEWVPARNLIFFSIAAGYCEAHNIDYIVLGGNLEESGAYPDNELIFQKMFDRLLPHALNLNNQVSLKMPVANLMKHEIVKMGIKHNAPLKHTWSCYENNKYHCGDCGPCLMRRTGFKMNGWKDIIHYEWLPEGFFNNCSTIEIGDSNE